MTGPPAQAGGPRNVNKVRVGRKEFWLFGEPTFESRVILVNAATRRTENTRKRTQS
jgi:hypothetical protein